jgi:hypothetical protein
MEKEKYPISWAEGCTLFKDISKKERHTFYGICGYSKRVFTIGTSLVQMTVVNDLYIGDGVCEEGERGIVERE